MTEIIARCESWQQAQMIADELITRKLTNDTEIVPTERSVHIILRIRDKNLAATKKQLEHLVPGIQIAVSNPVQ